MGSINTWVSDVFFSRTTTCHSITCSYSFHAALYAGIYHLRLGFRRFWLCSVPMQGKVVGNVARVFQARVRGVWHVFPFFSSFDFDSGIRNWSTRFQIIPSSDTSVSLRPNTSRKLPKHWQNWCTCSEARGGVEIWFLQRRQSLPPFRLSYVEELWAWNL